MLIGDYGHVLDTTLPLDQRARNAIMYLGPGRFVPNDILQCGRRNGHASLVPYKVLDWIGCISRGLPIERRDLAVP